MDEITQAQLVAELHNSCKVKPGDTIILHSSYKKIGPVAGGPMAVVKALKEAVGLEGTLLLPVFSSPTPDRVFKIKRTPSRVGLITEAFRRAEGVKRSMHPTHSVAAWGRRADEFLAGHDKTSALGSDSPFHKAAQARATILMIGCGLTTCSLVHVAEAIVRAPYLGKVFYGGYDKPMTLMDYEGNSHVVPPGDVPGDSAAFTAVHDELVRRGQMEFGQVGQAKTLRFDALQCLNAALDLLKKDMAVLLCKNPRCPVCPPSRKIIEEQAVKS